MGNNMDLNYEMFCYQCEQTANGKGCTKLGVCGKTPEIANLQDLLIFQVKGISCYGKVLMENGAHMDKTVVSFIENVLFTTLTNVNFDVDAHLELLRESQRIKEQVREMAGRSSNPTAHAAYDLPESKSDMLRDAQYIRSGYPFPAPDDHLWIKRHQRVRTSGKRTWLLQ